jgi:hypothetical protein
MDQLLVHILGDYFLQSDWMALNKSKKTLPCFVHCVVYTIPFVLLTNSLVALFVIFSSHFLFDRFSLVKYIIWIKNHINPKFEYYPFDKCSITGYYDDWNKENVGARYNFITTWLYIISDNAIHLAFNYFAINYL